MRGDGTVSVGVFKRSEDRLLLDLAKRNYGLRSAVVIVIQRFCRRLHWTHSALRGGKTLRPLGDEVVLQHGGQIADVEQWARIDRYHVLNTVLEFAHIAGPVVGNHGL